MLVQSMSETEFLSDAVQERIERLEQWAFDHAKLMNVPACDLSDAVRELVWDNRPVNLLNVLDILDANHE